jgi:O-methyltransferase StaMB
MPEDIDLKRRMEHAYTDDYLRLLGVEHYRLGYFTPDLAPDDLPAALERYLEVLLDPLRIERHHTLLDLGCNLGATASWLVRRYGCTVHAVDIVEDMVRAARGRFEEERIADRAFASCMDARRLEFADRTFDFVLGIEVVHHIPDKAACLAEIARVLKPGGQLVLTEYLLEPHAPWLGAAFVRMIVESDRLESERSYRALLGAAGLGETAVTDRYRETVVGTNRAFRSDRYRAKVRAYATLYFGRLFAAAMPAVYWLWEQMYRRGYARYAFIYSRKRS